MHQLKKKQDLFSLLKNRIAYLEEKTVNNIDDPNFEDEEDL